jgi:hypothetical protein
MMMDNAQKHNSCNNVQSSQTFKSHLLINVTVIENKKQIYDEFLNNRDENSHTQTRITRNATVKALIIICID